jgi:Flp pilus assembly protein TadB
VTRMIFLIPIPLSVPFVFIGVVALVLMAVAKIFWVFLFTVGPTAIAGILFVRWCWSRQDKRRARKEALLASRFQPKSSEQYK